MTVGSILGAVRRRWVIVLAGVLAGLLAAGAVSALIPVRYSASASVYVGGFDGAATGDSDLYADSLLVSQRAASYRELMISSRVLGPAAQRSGVPLAPDRVAVVSQAGSAVFGATVTDADPQRAAAAADAVARRFTEVITEVERPGGPGTPPVVGAVVLDAAEPPAAPTSPQVGSNLLLGAVAGFVVAVAIVVARAALDTTVRSAGRLRALTGAPVLATVPRVGGRRGAGPPEEDPDLDEAARRVRGHLLARSGRPGVVVVAGVTASEGVTTLVAALARALGGTGRVLAVDANLRRPALAERAGLAGTPGLTELLSRHAELDDVIRRGRAGDVLPAGGSVEDPGGLLCSPRAGEELTRLRGRYDVVLIDAPALGAAPDAAILAGHADGVLLTCREGVTSDADVEGACAALTDMDIHLLGAVLTMTTTPPPRYEQGTTAARPGAGVGRDAGSDEWSSGRDTSVGVRR